MCRSAVALLTTLALPVACTNGESPPAPSSQAVAAPSAAAAPTTADPRAVGANELGMVPVLMYHRIVASPQSVFDRTPEAFRAELVRLARENYVPVTAEHYVDGDLDLPAGTHPVVLTFDDGDPTQFALDARGEPSAGTAVSILRDVAGEYPRFRPVATFFVNADPFGDPGGLRTLPWLAAHGMEIGNHTATHANLGQSSPDRAMREIVTEDRAIRRAVPDFVPATLALPFGVPPDDPALAMRGAVGTSEYQYRGVFLVGANPAPSPYAADFVASAVPRIRSQDATGQDAEYCSTVWLDKLAATPAERYTSDGVAARVTYPAGSTQPLAARFQARALTY